MLWAARAMHLFSVILWIGGLLYQTVIVFPGLTSGNPERVTMALGQMSGFFPFIWMGLITVLVTGLGLMMFSPRFVFFSYSDWWSVALGIKQVLALLMVLFTFGYARMLARFSALVRAPDASSGQDPFLGRLLHFHRLNVVMGIIAILLSASMK